MASRALYQNSTPEKAEELYSSLPEPDPDYLNDDGDNVDQEESFPPPPPPLTAEELSAAVSAAYESHQANGHSGLHDPAASTDQAGLITPKKLPNPCVDSRERQALHRELLLNYKIGKDVLKKPELDKVMRDRKESQRRKEWDEKKMNNRSSLEMKLEERAAREKEEEQKSMKTIAEEEQGPELLRMHRKITLKASAAEAHKQQ